MNEREIAVYVLMDIAQSGAYNNIILRKTLTKNNALTMVQKNFVTETVNGVLRNLIYIDFVIDSFSKTKTNKMKPFILSLLRAGVYQIIFMDKVPDSAACNEAVILAKKKGFQNLSGFVNGVLRNVSRNKNEIVLPSSEKNPIEYLSVKFSYPEWITEKFVAEYGYEKTGKIFVSNNKQPKVSVMANTLKCTADELKEALESEGVEVEKSKFMDGMFIVSKTSDISKLESYKKGLFHVIDESAALVIQISEIKKDKEINIIDLCSAPGGKAFAASYASGGKAKVRAFDLYEHKVELINSGAERLGLTNIIAEISDATVKRADLVETADLLLLDVPCSGFGLMRKKPDIKLNRKPEDLKELCALQRKIIESSWEYVKKGGTILYSTCTLNREENEEIVEWITANYPLVLESTKKVMPDDFDTDGFFIAKLKRI